MIVFIMIMDVEIIQIITYVKNLSGGKYENC